MSCPHRTTGRRWRSHAWICSFYLAKARENMRYRGAHLLPNALTRIVCQDVGFALLVQDRYRFVPCTIPVCAMVAGRACGFQEWESERAFYMQAAAEAIPAADSSFDAVRPPLPIGHFSLYA